ncbi:MAG: hypothetical protein JNM00_11115, partial [Flavobacteriales bacterium]|nr:hypothetical protein [Flavobacteriales bacterium]
LEEFLPTLPVLKSGTVALNINTNTIPVVVLDLEFDCFKPNAVSDNLVEYTDGYWQDVAGRPEEPYEVRNGFVVLVDIDKYRDTNPSFRIDPSFFITNRGEPDLIEIDLDDGAGWQEISLGASVQGSYADTEDNRTIKVRVTRGSDVREGGCIMLKMGGESDFPDPHFVPYQWQSTETGDFSDPERPWRFGAPYGDETVYANAYTLWSSDGVLDKPFIFVEGIDFGRNTSATGNGTFGWWEFTSGLSEEYDFVKYMPVLLNELRANDYDIILLDFEDGAYYVERNASLLIKLIGLVNDVKVGKSTSVVAGASMGGQVTRYALAKMEQLGIPHCSRLWISHDSPHGGSYVPLGIMEGVKFMAHYRESADIFLNEFLLRPASRELLNIQIQGLPLDMNNSYYENLAELGYPGYLRRVAISNGMANGQGLGFEPGDPLLEYE